MESIAHSAVAGVIAALVATAVLGIARYVRHWRVRRQDVKYIRALLVEGRGRIMGARDVYFKEMGASMSAGAVRAAQYNNMLKQIGPALEKWAVMLSHDQRKDIYDALDWYHSDPHALPAIKRDGQVVVLELLEGRLPVSDMTLEAAKQRFENLDSIKWLKLNAN